MDKTKNITTKPDQDEEYYDNWSDYNVRDGKRHDRKKQEIEYARRLKSQEKDSFFSVRNINND
jgi:hypothetical protein